MQPCTQQPLGRTQPAQRTSAWHMPTPGRQNPPGPQVAPLHSPRCCRSDWPLARQQRWWSTAAAHNCCHPADVQGMPCLSVISKPLCKQAAKDVAQSISEPPCQQAGRADMWLSTSASRCMPGAASRQMDARPASRAAAEAGGAIAECGGQSHAETPCALVWAALQAHCLPCPVL